MIEEKPNIGGGEPECVPTQEEIQAAFSQLIGDKEYKNLQKFEDEKGPYLWEIIVPGESEDAEYSYKREGIYPEAEALSTAINVIFIDKAGFVTGGHSVAECIEGKLKLIC